MILCSSIGKTRSVIHTTNPFPNVLLALNILHTRPQKWLYFKMYFKLKSFWHIFILYSIPYKSHWQHSSVSDSSFTCETESCYFSVIPPLYFRFCVNIIIWTWKLQAKCTFDCSDHTKDTGYSADALCVAFYQITSKHFFKPNYSISWYNTF